MAFGGQRGTLSSALASITASNAVTTGGPITVAGGDLVYVVCGEQTGNTTTAVSDNLGNTYTATAAGILSAVSGRTFYARVTTAGSLSTVTTTATSSANDAVIIAVVIEGPFDIALLDKNPANISSDITTPFTCPATGVLAQANEVVMAWGVANYGTVWTATSPNLLSLDLASATNIKCAVGHQTVASTGSVSAIFAAAGNPANNVQGATSFKRDNSLQVTGPFGQTAQLDWELPPRKPDRRIIGIDWQQGALILPLGAAAPTTNVPRAPTYAPRTALPFHRYIQKWSDNLSASAPPGPTSATANASGIGSASAVGVSVDASKILRAPTVTPSWRQRYRIENLGWISLPQLLPPPFVSATASASGVGAASAVGTGINSSTASAAGTGTASGVGAATAASTASASGTGAATGVGIGINEAVATAAGVGAASATSASTAASTANAAGAGTATGVSPAVGVGNQPRAPTFTPTWPVRYRVENLGRVDFLSFLVQVDQPKNQYNWPNPRAPQWPISLRTWASGRVSVPIAAAGSGIGSAAATGTASGVGASTAASTASASGTGTASAVGTGINASTGTAAGVGAALGVGASTAASTASAAGVGTATATGSTALGSTASASGTGAAAATGASTAASTASASGVGTATAVGADAGGFVAATGNATGVGTATGAGGAIIAAVGSASGTGTANGQSPSLAGPPGGAGFVHQFTRKRWRELQLLIAAEEAARAKAAKLTTPAKKAPLLEAAEAASAAITAAQIEGENARLDALLIRNAATLRNAIRANTQVKLQQQAASAVTQSRAIAARSEDDEDMISILLLL